MRAPTGTLLRLALVVSAALVVVSGCSDEPDKPGTLPSPKATSSSAAPTPDTPEEQIEATMVAYFEETNRAFQSGNVTQLRKFSTSGCPCRNATNDIEKTINAGGRFEGLRYEVTSIQVHDVEGNTGLAEVIAQVPPYKVYDAEGDVTEDSKGGTLHTDFSLVRTDGRWVIGNALNLE